MSESYSKVKNNGISGHYTYHSFGTDNGPGNTIVPYSSTFGGGFGHSNEDRIDGIKLPDWRSRVKAGQDATTPLTGIKHSVLQRDLIVFSRSANFDPSLIPNTQRNDIYIGDISSDLSFENDPSTAVPGTFSSSVDNRVIAEFREQAESARSSVESLQDFGEYKETIRSLIHPVASLRAHVLSYFTSLKKLKRKNLRTPSLKKALADTYLEWTFGWKPLALDIRDAYKGLTAKAARPITQQIEAHAHETFTAQNNVLADQIASGSLQANIYKTIDTSYSVRYKGVVRTNANETGVTRVARELQVLPEYWAPTAWDLLPYSFIVDYFTNIGDIIKAFSFLDCNLIWGVKSQVWTTNKTYVIIKLDINNIFPKPNWIVLTDSLTGDRTKLQTKTFSRNPINSGDLIPSFQINLPHSIKPWENLGALLAAGSLPLVPFFK